MPHLAQRPFRSFSFSPLVFAGLLLAGLLAACGGQQAKDASLPLPPVARPALEREQQPTRERLAALHQRAESFGQDPAKSGAEKAAAYGELGQHYAALQQLETAAKCFENASLAEPGAHRWLYYRGVAMQDLARPAEAAELYRQALQLAPEDPPTVLHLAEVHLDQRQLDLAQPLFEKASLLAPGCSAALWGLGKIAGERGQWEKAVELLEKAAIADPRAGAVRRSLGAAWRALGDLGKARQLEGSNQIAPRCADKLADEIGDLINAASLERLRARVEQPNFDLRADLGIVIGQLGPVPGAAERVAAVAGGPELRANPRTEARWRLIAGALFASRGGDAQAEPELRRAIELDPALGEAQLWLGNLLVRRGELPAALAAYDAAAKLLPGDRELALRRGKLLGGLGRFDAAVGELRTAFSGGEGIIDAGLELAALLGHLGRVAEALPIYRQVIAKAPQDRRAREGESTALILLGRLGEAKTSLEVSVAELPAEISLQHALARLLAAGPPGVRDPVRGLELAKTVLRARPTIDRVETVAMAAAGSRDFRLAIELEGGLVDDARRAGRGELAARLGRRLELYRAGRPFITQGPGDLIVSPPLLDRSGAETRSP